MHSAANLHEVPDSPNVEKQKVHNQKRDYPDAGMAQAVTPLPYTEEDTKWPVLKMQAQNREVGSRRAAPATRQVSPRARATAAAMAALLAAVADGHIGLAEASEAAKLVDAFVRASEVTETAAREERVEALFGFPR
jgi:hypothetical protein